MPFTDVVDAREGIWMDPEEAASHEGQRKAVQRSVDEEFGGSEERKRLEVRIPTYDGSGSE